MYNAYQQAQSVNGQYYTGQASQGQMQPQNTGYGSFYNQGQPQQQNTEYIQQPIMQQNTGFGSGMPVTSFGQQQAPQSMINQGGINAPLQPQQTGFYRQPQQVMEPLKPTTTGFINSFANNGVDNSLKIPAIRLSFLTAQDQTKFETLFRSLVTPGSNTLSGDQCRNVFVKSGLQPSQLARIWTLADTSKAGRLLFPEFALAMYLVNSVLQGDSIPYDLDLKTKNEVSSFVDAINFGIGSDSADAKVDKPTTPFDDLTAGISMLQPQPTGYMPQLSFGSIQAPQDQQQVFTQQPTGGFGSQAPYTGLNVSSNTSGTQAVVPSLQAQLTGSVPKTSFNQPLNLQVTDGLKSVLNPQIAGSMPQTSFSQPPSQIQSGSFLQPQPTGYLPPSNFQTTAPLQSQKTGFGNNELYTPANFTSKFTPQDEDVITPEEKSLFYKIFETYDTEKSGNLNSPIAVEIFRKSGLNRSDLEHIWNLCDTNNSGNLNKQEFALGMHLVYRRLNGHVLPNRLPPSLIPSSTKILNNLKDQLKKTNITSKDSSSSDAARFKHNDDELLPSSRNRRKTFDKSKKRDETMERITELKKLIREKKDLLNMEKTRLDRDKLTQENERKDILRKIDNLKIQIQSLPEPFSRSEQNREKIPSELRSKFEALSYRLPGLLSEISQVGNDLRLAKLKLYRLKNTSSIVGTGPNGEITDYDRKKAKQKLLLANRMAALTGKPVDQPSSESIEDEERRYNEEISRIQEEQNKNELIINDIYSSIQEISSSVRMALDGTNAIDMDDSKWKSGIGLESEVRDFIKTLDRNHDRINMYSRMNPSVSSTIETSSTSLNYADLSPNYSGASAASMPTDNLQETKSKSNYSAHRTPEERAAYIKEQARKKMGEKLAKLGIKRGGTQPPEQTENKSNSMNPQSTTSTSQTSTMQHKQNVPLSVTKENSTVPPNKVIEKFEEDEEEDDDDDDEEEEEEKRLLEQLRQLKLKKKKEKKERLEHLRRQVEEAKAAENEEDDSWEDKSVDVSLTMEKQTPEITHHAGNPFGKTQNDSQITAGSPEKPLPQNHMTTETDVEPPLSSTSTGGRNPFFKQQAPSVSSFDAKAAEIQRRIQRGLDDDSDGWSDEELPPKNDEQHPTMSKKTDSTSSQQSIIPPPPPLPQVHAVDEPVPVAPPLPQVHAVHEPVPVAPPLPQVHAVHEPIPVAPPLPQVHAVDEPVPVAPPLPQVGGHMEQVPVSIASNPIHADEDEESDNLSIPESVESDDAMPPIPSIPPPPPLP